MKHLKKFENFASQDINIEQISFDDLKKLISDEKHPWLIAKEGESATIVIQDIPLLSSEQVFKTAEENNDTIIIIDEDAFASIPSVILNRCSLAIIPADDKYFDESLKYTTTKVYRMPY